MKTRPHKIQCAALILLAASMTSPVFPRHQSRPDRAVPQGLAGFRENKATGAATTAGTASGLRLPLSFEKNRGQAEGDVEFVGRGDGMALFLKPDEAVLALQDRRQPLTGRNAADVTPSNDEACRAFRISMTLDGANSAPVISGVEKQEARANYFIGADPVKWIRGVETYSGVSYSGVYPGIDLLFYGSEQQLEYDFTVDPGADPEQIRLRFGGADNLELSGDGALIIHLTAGDVTHDPPVAYQDVDGVILSVPAAFKRRPNGSIGFEIGNYDQTRTLVIDPVLVYSSYIGGTAADSCRGVTLDSAGNAYLVGDSVSSDFLRNASAGNSDVFVGKLNRNGLLLTYTFFGGSKDDSSTGLAVDPSGNIYLCGITLSPDFPTFNSVSSVLMGPEDAFVVKLTPTADQFFYSTLLG